SRTALGPVASWPQSLRTCVRIILTSSQPMFVWWGDQLINLYNDAYCSILAGKHPWALGRPAAEVWREIWSDVSPRATRAMRENRGTFDEALLLIMERSGYREETYYTFSYSPVPGDRGGPGGILCANSSDTQRIFGERQQALLREVSTATVDARTTTEVCERTVVALASNPRDLPFALLYTVDDDIAELCASTGIDRNHPLATSRVHLSPTADDSGGLSGGALGNPVHEILRTRALSVRSLDGVPAIPRGVWDEPATELIGVPIAHADRALAAVLVVARNPFRRLDDDYQRFLELLGGQIGSALANVNAYEAERTRAEALTELDRAKSTFFSNISHEFRTPITLMLGPTEDALRAEPRALVGDALTAVHRNELRLLKLVNALLDFSRIESGRVRANYEAVELGQYTRELASSFRSAMERAKLRFEVMVEPIGGAVFVDRSMWETIVLNLLSNALKFTFDGEVRLELHDRGAEVELAVTDTGTGIPADELPRLFERFHRVEGARSRTHEGSGIGLALAHELIRLHHGTIEVRSELGRGTTFTVRVPKQRDDIAVDRPPLPPQASAISAVVEESLRWLPAQSSPQITLPIDAPPLAGPSEGKLLVADDNADMRDYLRRLLAGRWAVTVVADGKQALEAARRDRPDLVLTDVMMPELDGFGVLRALRAEPGLATVPVVMLSARAGEAARVDGIEAGADDYLIKPFSARELIARVSNLLQLARLRREVELERNRLHAFIDAIPVAVVIFEGPELRLRLSNDAYQRIVQRPIRPGVTLRELLPELEGTGVFERLERCYRENIAIDVPENRIALRRDDGVPATGYFSSSYRALRGADGEPTGVMIVTVEVTDQVAARHAAEAANRAKDEFLAMLGHELRNPLAPILTALELMRLRGAPGLERERAVIQRQTEHLAALVDDLLDVSRITRGMVELKRERLSLAHIVAKAIETAAPLYEQQRHELATDVPLDLAVDADESRLTQVFANLLTNAAKYTDPGGRVSIHARRDADDVLITVSDNGRGISPEILPNVFDLFVQERQNLDRSRGGLGLGLAIVRSLVELHGGRVQAASKGAGQGSSFSVRLPSVPSPHTHTAAQLTGPEQPVAMGISVLIVDDNIDAAAMLAELLGASGYHTMVANDGPQA
ncbi:MAG: ATP-binding protein, partial [Kofleriaceae bacterium]